MPVEPDKIIQIVVNDSKLFALTQRGLIYMYHVEQWKTVALPPELTP